MKPKRPFEDTEKRSHHVNDWGKYVVYFLLGGTIVSLSTYLGAQGRPYLAAFASTFPAITGATFVLLYLNGGSNAIVAYAEKLFWFVPPWIVYVMAMIFVVPRLGFWPAMALSLVLYMGCVWLVKLALR
jgi:hypothetical protein